MYNNLGNKSSYTETVQSFAFIIVWLLDVHRLTLEISYLAV